MIYVYGPTFFDFKVSSEDRSPTQNSTTWDNAYIASISNKAASIIMELEDLKCKPFQCALQMKLLKCQVLSNNAIFS